MEPRNKVNTTLGILSFAAAVGMAADIIYHINKYGDIAKTSDMAGFCKGMLVGTAIMVIIGIVLINSRKHDPYKRIAIILIVLLAAGYGTSCMNHMLGYVVASYNYEESE